VCVTYRGADEGRFRAPASNDRLQPRNGRRMSYAPASRSSFGFSLEFTNSGRGLCHSFSLTLQPIGSLNHLLGSREQGCCNREAGILALALMTSSNLVSCRTGKKNADGTLAIGRPIQPPMLLWPKPLDLRLERGFDRPVRRLNGDHARPSIFDTSSLADALDLRALLREFASAQD
jgi:hypothetical protein